ncbi:acetoacetate decarboxylase family protein [Planobispora longispora]|uniref:Acetoacetate decarboxylase n=1 Tax=Planobispora longispora TaxID=28887 RepID=A0A8J3RIG9_9ACTN|nr:acetoacetate decarboxylase family protein [Planobispora longispora]GIH74457.1 hypothetical protein Plo01_08860 [Planobispora longispora]
MARHLIQGRAVAMPVRIRHATVCTAAYLVRADAARAVIAYSGMDVAEVLPGRTVCSLAFVDYVDGDLDAYHEFGVTFMVRPPEAGPAARKGPVKSLAGLRRSGAGVFVHWLPVDQGFTLEAGRTIWGFPKELATIDLRLSSPYKRCVVRKDDRLVIDMLVKPGVPVTAAGATFSLDAYSHLDGVTRRIPWTVSPRGIRVRPGGALVRLGNHPVARELSELGLPKRAVMTAGFARVAMSFEEAKET